MLGSDFCAFNRGALEKAVLDAYEAELARVEAEKRFQLELENV